MDEHGNKVFQRGYVLGCVPWFVSLFVWPSTLHDSFKTYKRMFSNVFMCGRPHRRKVSLHFKTDLYYILHTWPVLAEDIALWVLSSCHFDMFGMGMITVSV